MLISFLHCQLLQVLVFFLLYRPAAHRIFVFSMRKTRCWCRSKHYSSVAVCMHLFTVYLHLSPHAPGLQLREATVKYLATCLPPFLKPAVMWPRESQTAADCQSWCSLRIYYFSPTLQKFRIVSDFKSQVGGPVPHMASMRLGAFGRNHGNPWIMRAPKLQPVL